MVDRTTRNYWIQVIQNKEREVMKIYDIIVEDDNGKLYRLDSAWCNENFNYDPEHDKIELIK